MDQIVLSGHDAGLPLNQIVLMVKVDPYRASLDSTFIELLTIVGGHVRPAEYFASFCQRKNNSRVISSTDGNPEYTNPLAST